MRRLKTLGTTLLVALVLVTCGDYVAFAATGQSLLLGRSNSAGAQTTVSRTTSGAVLGLHSASTSNPPLAVNGTGKVTNLNADRVDSLDSTKLQNTVWVYTYLQPVAGNAFQMNLPLPTGKYLLSYSARLIGAGSADVDCYFWKVPSAGSSSYFGESLFHSGTGTHPGLTGSGYVEKETGTAVRLKCTSTVNFTVLTGQPVQVVATRVDRVAAETALP